MGTSIFSPAYVPGLIVIFYGFQIWLVGGEQCLGKTGQCRLLMKPEVLAGLHDLLQAYLGFILKSAFGLSFI